MKGNYRPKVKCVFCSKHEWPGKMYYCGHCGFWICGRCIEKPGLFATGSFMCPRCHNKVTE